VGIVVPAIRSLFVVVDVIPTNTLPLDGLSFCVLFLQMGACCWVHMFSCSAGLLGTCR